MGREACPYKPRLAVHDLLLASLVGLEREWLALLIPSPCRVEVVELATRPALRLTRLVLPLGLVFDAPLLDLRAVCWAGANQGQGTIIPLERMCSIGSNYFASTSQNDDGREVPA